MLLIGAFRDILQNCANKYKNSQFSVKNIVFMQKQQNFDNYRNLANATAFD